jgi:hypothetical protein
MTGRKPYIYKAPAPFDQDWNYLEEIELLSKNYAF